MITEVLTVWDDLLRPLFATQVAPPNLALIFMQTLDMYWGEADMTCLAWRT